MGAKTYRWEQRELRRLFDKNVECDYCGEPVQSMESLNADDPMPHFMNEANGRIVKCGDCCQTDWEDYCYAVGANPKTGIWYGD